MLYRDKVKLANPTAYTIIKNAINTNKVAHAFIFSAPKRVAIEDEPMFLIQSLISENPFEASELRRIESYPDLTIIDGSEELIKKESVTDAAEKLLETPFETNGKKILLIKNLENANSQSLNSLLKFIEEPTKDTYIIMTTNNISQVLSTIRSRSQVIALKPKSVSKFTEELKQRGMDDRSARILARMTTSVDEADAIFKDHFSLIIDEQIDILEDALRDRHSFYTHLDKKVTKKNFAVYLNVLNVFFNDVWRHEEGMTTAFDNEHLLSKYALSKVDYATALKELNDFFVAQDYYVNFDLYKAQLLLKLVRCYE